MAQGAALLEAKDYLGAQDAFNSAQALSPGAIEPQLFRARAYHLASERERAASIFKTLFDDCSGERKGEIALWIATSYNSLRDYEPAFEWITHIGNERLKVRLNIYFLFRLGRRMRPSISAGSW